MPWFPVDDNFAFHVKVVRAGNEAVGLWVRAGSWCAQHLTDGYVPADIVEAMGGTKLAPRLVASGLWREVGVDGYQFHEWNAPGRNPTRADVEARRSSAATRQANYRRRKETT